MKSLITFIFSLIVLESYAQTETPEQVLAKMEDKRIAAVISRDSVTLLSLYDESYRGVLTNGRHVTKSGVLRFQLTNNPNIKITIEEVEATIHGGGVGVVTGKQVNRSKSGNLLGQSRFVRVYEKFGNDWRIVYSQGTLFTDGK